jgi:hypothetical protein
VRLLEGKRGQHGLRPAHESSKHVHIEPGLVSKVHDPLNIWVLA